MNNSTLRGNKFSFVLGMLVRTRLFGQTLTSDFEIQLNYFKVSFRVSLYEIIKNTVINCVILLAKHYIFSSKYKQWTRDLIGLLLMLKRTRDYEKYIALSKDKIELHDRHGKCLEFYDIMLYLLCRDIDIF